MNTINLNQTSKEQLTEVLNRVITNRGTYLIADGITVAYIDNVTSDILTTTYLSSNWNKYNKAITEAICTYFGYKEARLLEVIKEGKFTTVC